MPAFIIGTIFIALVVGIIALIAISVQKRKEDLAAIARELKLQFFPKGDDRIAPLLEPLEFFHYGHSCKVSNLIYGNIARGKKSVTVAIFDYQYAIGKERTVVNYNDRSVSVSIGSNARRYDFWVEG